MFPGWTATASSPSASRPARAIGIGGSAFFRVLITGDEIVEGFLHRWQAVSVGVPVTRDIARGFPAIAIRTRLPSRFLLGQPIKQVVGEASLIPFEDRRWFRGPLITGGSISSIAASARIVASTRTILASSSWLGGRSHVLTRTTVTGSRSLLAARAIPAGTVVTRPVNGPINGPINGAVSAWAILS